MTTLTPNDYAFLGKALATALAVRFPLASCTALVDTAFSLERERLVQGVMLTMIARNQISND